MQSMFDNDDDRFKFNEVTNKVRDDVICHLYEMISDEKNVNKSAFMEKFNKLPKNVQRRLLKKALLVNKWLSKDNNFYDFSDCIKQVLLNLLKGSVLDNKIRYSRRKEDYQKGNHYAKKLLKYEVFLLIIDLLALIDITENVLGNYDKHLQSTMCFTVYGRTAFKDFIDSNVRFMNGEKQDLIIKTDKVRVKVLSGKNKGEFEEKKIVVPYEITDPILKKIKKLKKFNAVYEDQNIKILYDEKYDKEELILKVNFLESLYYNYLNALVDIDNLDITVIGYERLTEDDKTKYSTFVSSLLLNNKIHIRIVNTNLLRSKHINSSLLTNINTYTTSKGILPLVGKKDPKGYDFNELIGQNGSNEKCEIIINKLDLTINKKNIYRVYSRNS